MTKTARTDLKIRLLFMLIMACIGLPIEANSSTDILYGRRQYNSFQNVSIPIDLGMVGCIIQDGDGMMWFGTRCGLCSWNGYQLHTYLSDIDLNSRFVNCLIDGSGDVLYVGTDLGLLAFDKRKKTFSSLPCTAATAGARQMVQVGNTLYISTAARGIISYDIAKKTTRTLPSAPDAMLQAKGLTVAEGRLYVGYYHGLVSMDMHSGKWRREGVDAQVKINSIYYDKGSRSIYIATDGQGFLCYSLRSHQTTKIAAERIRHAKVVAADGRGNILCGTEEGLYVYSPATQGIEQATHDSRLQSSLSNDMVRSIATDRDGNVFIGTDRGVSVSLQYDHFRIVPLANLTGDGHGNLLTSVLHDKDNGYWIGGEHGLLRIDKDKHCTLFATSSPSHQLRNNYIRCIYKDSDGRLWIATDDGVALYNRLTDGFDIYDFHFHGTSFNSRWSYDFAEDGQGRLWIASYFGGLFVVDKRKIAASQNRQIDADTVLLGYQAYQVARLDDVTMAANTDKGIAFIDTRSMEVKQTRAFDDNMVVFNGAVYYSSMGRLYRLNRQGESTEIVYDCGMDRKIHSYIAETSRLWFSTSSNLYYYDAASNHVERYTAIPQGFMAGMIDMDGESLLWVGNDCMALVPLSSVDNRAERKGRIAVTAVLSGGVELLPDSDYQARLNGGSVCEIRLKRRGDFQLELSQFDYAGAAQCEFYYQMDGNGAWNKLESASNTLSLVALSGGRHTLRLSSQNPQIDQNATVSTVVLLVPHPWYATPWAILAYILAALLLIIYIIRRIARRNRQRYEQRERERVLELSSLKMDFFVNISHELKTPLSLILAPVGRLMGEMKDGRAKEQLAIVEKNALRLNSLIRKILDFKRLEYEREETLMLTRVDMVELLRGSMANFAASAEQRGIEIRLDADVDRLPMDVDVIKIESIMANLLSNALRHVADHTGRVVVTLSQTAGRTEISVADNGAGVSERELPLLFERYFHGDAIQTGSTGIGLHLVKKFTELHGGTVTAKNADGLRVTVSLPSQDLTTQPAQNLITPEPQNLKTSQAHDLILIVDDNSEILDFISQSLADDYHCLTAQDGLQAWDIICQHRPQLAIVDQMMPRMDGMTLVRKIRDNMPTASLPIIMLTAKDDEHTEMESLKTGVDVFIAKPFDMHKLQLHIVRLLKSRSTIEQCRRITEIANPDYEPSETAPSSDEALLSRINEIIDREMSSQGFTIESLAEATNLSTKSLYRKVKQLTGLTPVNYLRRLRMKKAAALLAGQSFTVAEVCYMVGLTNVSYFTKCFTDEFGISPRDYAKKPLPASE